MSMDNDNKPTAVPAAPAVELTAEQRRIAQLFVAMDRKAQISLMCIAEAFAKKRPHHSKPALRLVSGGAK